MKVNKELSKGSHELILLKLLSRRDMYGYQLIQEMALLSENAFSMSQGSLYPFLHALEEKKYITSYTAAGNAALEDKQTQWAHYVRAMGRILGGEPT